MRWRWVVVWVFVMGCGTNIRHYGGEGESINDFSLVRVFEQAPPDNARVVSVSLLDSDSYHSMPARPSDSELENMRKYAGSHGATRLYLQRFDSAYRKVFVAIGMAPLRAAREPELTNRCELRRDGLEVVKAADRCYVALQQLRPQLQGEVKIDFTVAPDGSVLNGQIHSDSSLDAELRQCAQRALFAHRFAEPQGLICDNTLSIRFGRR